MAAIMSTMLAMAIFCDDRAMFDRAVNHFIRGPAEWRHHALHLSHGHAGKHPRPMGKQAGAGMDGQRAARIA